VADSGGGRGLAVVDSGGGSSQCQSARTTKEFLAPSAVMATVTVLAFENGRGEAVRDPQSDGIDLQRCRYKVAMLPQRWIASPRARSTPSALAQQLQTNSRRIASAEFNPSQYNSGASIEFKPNKAHQSNLS